MKNFLLSSAVILALTVAGGTAYKAVADTGQGAGISQPPGPPGPPGGPGECGGPGSWGPGGWGPGGKRPGGPGFWQRRDNKFSLFAPVQNKALSDSDVKIIATALLLEHGNHDWSVSNVVTETDKSIEFSFATAHGDVVATFAIDPASGRIKRVS